MKTDAPRSPAAADAAPRVCAALTLAIAGDLRFLSHHNELRMLARAVVRAHWPLAYSQGFNPQPRLNIPLPRSVGVAATSQLALVELSEPRAADELAAGLRAALPEDCRLVDLICPAARATPHPRGMTYEVALEPGDATGLPEAIARVLAAPMLPVERGTGPGRPVRKLDVRPLLESLELEGGVLRMKLLVIGQNLARPTEIVLALGLAAEAYAHRLCRTAVKWDMELARPDDGPAADTRIELGQEENDRPLAQARTGS